MILIKNVCRLPHNVAQEWLSNLLPLPGNEGCFELEEPIEVEQSFEGKPLFIYYDARDKAYWLAFMDV
jgi:hypothetical protein